MHLCMSTTMKYLNVSEFRSAQMGDLFKVLIPVTKQKEMGKKGKWNDIPNLYRIDYRYRLDIYVC